jgi:hypothetical protein
LQARAEDVQAALTILGTGQLWAGVEPLVLSSVDLRKAELPATRALDVRLADGRTLRIQDSGATEACGVHKPGCGM